MRLLPRACADGCTVTVVVCLSILRLHSVLPATGFGDH